MTSSQDRLTCPGCAESVPPDSKFCVACGRAIGEGDSLRQRQQQAGALVRVEPGSGGFCVSMHLPALEPVAQPGVAELRETLEALRADCAPVRIDRSMSYGGMLFEGIRVWLEVSDEQEVPAASEQVRLFCDDLDPRTLKGLGVYRPAPAR